MHGVIAVKDLQAESYVHQGECDWVALLAQPGSERKACIWLRRRQFKPYWARYKGQVKLNRHRRAMRWRSVIPGYLFLPVITDINWRLIEETPGVHGKMTNGEGRPKLLNRGHINDIVRIEEALNSSEINAVQGIPFKVGQRVRPTDDLYYHWEGPITRIDSRRQIAVEVPGLFGAPRIVMFSADRLEAV
jgi:transcription antitermination factor NusG